jgi:hypothetical protein|tara:strand:+ start:644 stop:850 length:207 start_codon:yes stop_codon:yes gene_type:complete
MLNENQKLLEAIKVVNEAVKDILDKEEDPQKGASLNSSIEMVTVAISGYTLLKEMMTLPLPSEKIANE